MKFRIGAGFAVAVALLLFFNASGLLGLFMLAAAIHELGHLAAIMLCRSKLTEIRLELTGAAIYYDRSSVGYGGDALIALAGPLLGTAAAFAAARLGFDEFAGICLVLNAVNLLPAIPLDGGRILASLMGLIFGERGVILIVVHCVTCFGLLILGTYILYATGGNFTCLLLALWLLFSSLKNN
ncbi:MAG: hypothetical protein LBN43_08835 [Oscillospiraceae bacterium]|nr:hypothetical protein [Oscillospiraceae bacterium]